MDEKLMKKQHSFIHDGCVFGRNVHDHGNNFDQRADPVRNLYNADSLEATPNYF
jgi:hypothetical protein